MLGILSGSECCRMLADDEYHAEILMDTEPTVNCDCGCKDVPLSQVVTIEDLPCCVACATCQDCGATATCTNDNHGGWSCAAHEYALAENMFATWGRLAAWQRPACIENDEHEYMGPIAWVSGNEECGPFGFGDMGSAASSDLLDKLEAQGRL